jgi:HEAT repeat protein
MADARGEQLIRDLLADPRKFGDEGRAYGLLQAYFEGLPLETLHPLLRSDDSLVQRAAVFVASELGSQAKGLVDDVIPLLHSGDRYLQYHAMEVLAVCCEAERAKEFAHVAQALESDDDVLRALAMRLISSADVSQLEAARRIFETPDSHHQTHDHALATLAEGNRVDPAIIVAMIHNADPLVRRYGAIAAKRLIREFPNLMTELESIDDADLRNFYQGAIDARTS